MNEYTILLQNVVCLLSGKSYRNEDYGTKLYLKWFFLILQFLPDTAIGDVVVVRFDCTDLDNNLLTYSLVQNPADGTFEVDAATSQLRVKGKL